MFRVRRTVFVATSLATLLLPSAARSTPLGPPYEASNASGECVPKSGVTCSHSESADAATGHVMIVADLGSMTEDVLGGGLVRVGTNMTDTNVGETRWITEVRLSVRFHVRYAAIETTGLPARLGRPTEVAAAPRGSITAGIGVFQNFRSIGYSSVTIVSTEASPLEPAQTLEPQRAVSDRDYLVTLTIRGIEPGQVGQIPITGPLWVGFFLGANASMGWLDYGIGAIHLEADADIVDADVNLTYA